MTIQTRNEVLVTCQDAPLMELVEHLLKDHSIDLDYCLEELGLDYTVEKEPQTARTRQEFLDLPLGTVVKVPVAGTHYKTAMNAWVKPSDLPYSSPTYDNDDMWAFTVSVNAPAVVLFTPEVQA